MNITRRGLLFGIGALAATAVLPDEITPLPETDMQRLLRLARTSCVIEDQIFVLDGPVVLTGINDLLIQRCHFILPEQKATDPYMFDLTTCQNLRVSHCHFKYPQPQLPDNYTEYRWQIGNAKPTAGATIRLGIHASAPTRGG